MNSERSGVSVYMSHVLVALLLISAVFVVASSVPGQETMGDVKWSFVVYSDNRGSNPTHRAVLAAIAKVKPDIILNLGDMLFRSEDYGTMDSFKRDVEESYGDFDDFLRIFYPSVGGHDERYYNQNRYPPHGREPDNKAGRKLYDQLRLRERVSRFNDKYGDYYFSHKGVHFIVFYRSDEWEFKDEQVSWFEDTLERIDGPVVVAGHAGGWFYPLSDNQRKIIKLMRKHKVDIALAADWHDYYANADGDVIMFRSGSAGWGDALFIRFDVTDKGFIIRALEPDGVTLFTKHRDADGQIIHPYWIKRFGKPAEKVSY